MIIMIILIKLQVQLNTLSLNSQINREFMNTKSADDSQLLQIAAGYGL